MKDRNASGVREDEAKDLDQLILMIGDGDKKALQTLYYQCKRGIFAVAYSVLHDYQLAEDVLQETILKIWEHASSYQNGSRPKAWVYAIARNQSLDMVKQQNITSSIEDFEDTSMPDVLVTRVDYDAKLVLTSGLDCLDPDDALIVVLKVIVGFSHLETSRLLNIPYRTVRYRYLKAISRLKIFLTESNEHHVWKESYNENDEKNK